MLVSDGEGWMSNLIKSFANEKVAYGCPESLE